jgi:type IV pilus assembly protein PilE
MALPFGFTLIELLVVLAVMTILAAIAHASYREFTLKAKRTEGKAALLQLLQQQERYYTLHNSYIEFSSTSTDEDERKFKWYSGEMESTSAYEIVGEACPGDVIRNCLQLTAKPGTSRVDANFKDPHCGALIATSAGTRKADNEDCWK